jgi:hypothetical protein
VLKALKAELRTEAATAGGGGEEGEEDEEVY